MPVDQTALVVPALGDRGATYNARVAAMHARLVELQSAASTAPYNVKDTDYGALGNGTADDTAAIQACINAAGVAGRVEFPAGNYLISATLKYLDGQRWTGAGVGTILTGQTKITAGASFASGSMIEATNKGSANSVNVTIENISVIGGAYADVGIDLTRTSYSTVERCFVSGTKASAVGFMLDANTTDACYFNAINQCRGAITNGTGIRFKRGANVNQVNGGAMVACATGADFYTSSSGNLMVGTDFELNTVKHIYIDAPANAFVACHLEGAPIGFDQTANGNNTVKLGNTYAASCLIPEQNVGTGDIQHENQIGDLAKWSLGFFKTTAQMYTTGTAVEIDAKTYSGTANSILRFFRNTTTTGTREVVFYLGDGTTTQSIKLDMATGDITTLSGKFLNGTYGFFEGVGTAAPASGTHVVGSIVRNRLPAVGSPKAWVCTVAGTPGTWVSTGNL